ncbi:hypothetical protein DFA_09688 [Cavenderia fasciculata]|uniref:ABC transporter domain-containing protein n=1 Tax=Cavenderia fasciculata TaxID=261658 RepID=F4Q8B6_CACFS|nr:uncharacterized protein DFA_09688 [Cavenderia fasciculata]EGG16016.1 hypothetical protein DFA_09688 [Cavenderia fasciculata]|eukprot:XP_004352341.1 hypothetical protein DFA_09688 [Cavenderia fasciculata]
MSSTMDLELSVIDHHHQNNNNHYFQHNNNNNEDEFFTTTTNLISNNKSNINGKVQLVFKNISYSINKKPEKVRRWIWPDQRKKGVDGEVVGGASEKTGNSKQKEITILHNVSGVVEPGSLLALMGPSGSGKSTLIDILAKRKSSGTVTGEILVNGKQISDSSYKQYCSYVTQEDTLLQTSTVEETLTFYADLRLHGYTREQKMERVRNVLQEIGLTEKADTKIGGLLPGGIVLGGLSGGEKRRVSIGCGLVTNPSIIICDEATSGLDSASALSVMNTLTSLTQKGVTVICSIHQPRTEIYNLFSKVMILVKGRLIYGGNKPLAYFESLGYSCPTYLNPADFFLDTAVSIGESFNYLDICEQWENNKESLSMFDNLVQDLPIEIRPRPSGLYQYKVLVSRQFKDYIRNPGNFWSRTITAFVMGLLYGACFANLSDSQEDISKKIGLLFFLGGTFNLLPFTSISLFLSGRTLFNAERAAKIYHPFPYFIAMLSVEFVTVFCVTIALAGTTYWISDLRSDVPRFFFAMLVLLVVHILSDLCIITLSNLTATQDHAISINSALTIVYQLFAGFYVPVKQLPSGFSWLHWISPLFYAFTSLMINEFDEVILQCPEPPKPCLFPTGYNVLDYWGITTWSRENTFAVVVTWMVVFFFTAYWALCKLHKEKR